MIVSSARKAVVEASPPHRAAKGTNGTSHQETRRFISREIPQRPGTSHFLVLPYCLSPFSRNRIEIMFGRLKH
ncbi:hypothetical protein GCM10007868_30530 [Gluconobacter frateurii]|uniref:Transposase n=1 Tax=Gluconobacter frateurii NRIC 0228 TaxID=1307946 RepID=A0ABQ0Q8W8_9PROT|nr:hypothetical protein AA0228_0659 [Gluconobacter frateurii NRIC 0228]GLP91978.1 hypothetical protein GCM10007868_30530 [Gluconobacter frateurii]